MHASDVTGTRSDDADTLYRVYIEIADHEDFGKRVIERFLRTRGRDIPGEAQVGCASRGDACAARRT